MIFSNSKVLFLSGVLAVAVRPGVLANNEGNENGSAWIKHARKLQTDEFLQLCGDVFMTPDHMQQHSYLMSDFADEVTNLCLKIAPSPDQGTCQQNSFNSLDSSLQTAFFRHAAQHMGNKIMPMDMMMQWGNAGYVVSNKTAVEQEAMRGDLCVEVREAIGEEFLEHIPTSNEPDTHELLPETKPERPPLPENNNDDFEIVHAEKEEGAILSITAIVAICCAVAAAIALFFYYEARRRNQARVNRMSRFNKGGKGFDEGVIRVNTSSGGKKAKSNASSSHPIEEIKAAINEADWDSVYRLASQLAENDDGLSLYNLNSLKGQNRRHLGAEDRQRAKTLEDLAVNGDWTGLAVTAALYAGETSGSSASQSDEYSYYTEESSVEENSDSGSQDVEGQPSMERMVSKLSKALNAGNWQQVTKYANLIKDEKNAGSTFDTSSKIILRTPSSSSSVSKTEMSKKETIAKLIKAGKWKGVGIMANMYEMESKQVQSSSVRPYPPSPNHPYSDTRSILRTKELRHSDRVQENIVGFRRDP